MKRVFVLAVLGLAALYAACGDDDPAAAPPSALPDAAGGGSPEAAAVDTYVPPIDPGDAATEAEAPKPVALLSNVNTPVNVTTMLGAVYASVYGENRVVRIEGDGGAVSDLAGSPIAPWGLAATTPGFNGQIGVGELRDGGAAVGAAICSSSSCYNIAKMSTTEPPVWHVAFDGSGHFYWVTATGVIRRKDVNSGLPYNIVTGETGAYGIAVFSPWIVVTRRESAGRVRRIRIDATEKIDLVTGLSFPEGIVGDYTTVWIADTGNDRIVSCAIAGCGGTGTVFATAKKPRMVAYDIDNVYWTNGVTPNGSVQWCPKAGCPASGPNTLADNQPNPSGIRADGKFVYWANSASPGAVMRANKP
jgi:hypothetical protein